MATLRLKELFADNRTYAHENCVSSVARSIAVEMGMDLGDIRTVGTAGRLHDIGKLAVPNRILHKPGSLTHAEFKMIRKHPEAGFGMLRGIVLPEGVSEAIVAHHERSDGSGYPFCLSGKEIPVTARILAVADVAAAMTEPRSYRPALAMDEVFEELIKVPGRYDGVVVDAFRNVVDRGRTAWARRRWTDEPALLRLAS